MSSPKTRKNKRKVIFIDGIAGSGKSFLLDQLASHGFHVVDTDTVYHKTVKSMSKTRKFRKWYGNPVTPYPAFDKQLDKGLEAEIAKSKKSITIVAGMTIPLSATPNTAYFIRIDDLEATYKRFMLREITKIQAAAKVTSAIKTDTDYVSAAIEEATGQSGLFPTSYVDYKKTYEWRLADAKKSKYKILSQSEILKDVLENACI